MFMFICLTCHKTNNENDKIAKTVQSIIQDIELSVHGTRKKRERKE